jgi:protein-tyrosine phosphatase
VIEIHAHLLPGVDDGPESLEESLALAQAFIDDGVRHVVATPHVYPGLFPNTRSSNIKALALFQQALAERGISLSLQVAGEVRLTEHIPQLLETNELPFLGEVDGYRTLLLEMPDGQIPVGTDRLVAWLLERGIRPVIAHPERNRAIRDKPKLGLELVQMGCLLQVTAGALIGGFGAPVQKAARFLVKKKAVAAIASDAHNLAARAPCMGAAFAWLSNQHGEEVAVALTQTGPASLCGYVG